MAFLDIKNVAIRGVSACVPKTIVENVSFYEDLPAFNIPIPSGTTKVSSAKKLS